MGWDADGLPQHRRSGSKQRRWNRKPAGWGWRLLELIVSSMILKSNRIDWMGVNIRIGTLKQLRPMRSSPLLQQAIFWPLPHLGALDWDLTPTSVFPPSAPWGAAKATAATEAMRRDLKKAILVVGVVLVEGFG